MKRLLTVITAAVLALSLLAGCGGDETSADAKKEPTPSESVDQAAGDAPGAGTKYCELLSTDFATLFANIEGPEDVNDAVDVIEEIANEAPAEVEDEWGVMQGALGTMEGALTRAAELQEKAASGDVSPEELKKQTAALMKDMEALDTPENNKAGDAVSAHAADYCGLQLG